MKFHICYYWKFLCLCYVFFMLTNGNDRQNVVAFSPSLLPRQITRSRFGRYITTRQLYLQDVTSGSFNNMTRSGRGGAIPVTVPPTPASVRNNFGDIMSPSVADAEVLFRDGLVTSTTQSLAKLYNLPNPLDRMAVTANGNLQRLVSSYYDAPVTVVVMKSVPMGTPGLWDRRVHLQVYGQTFCVADSTVQVHSDYCRDLVESGQVGLGQLFRHLNILPEFALQAAGPTDDGGFWRQYTLTCADVSCSIYERFIPGMWELQSPTDD